MGVRYTMLITADDSYLVPMSYGTWAAIECADKVPPDAWFWPTRALAEQSAGRIVPPVYEDRWSIVEVRTA